MTLPPPASLSLLILELFRPAILAFGREITDPAEVRESLFNGGMAFEHHFLWCSESKSGFETRPD
jgi:hypothetical protein